MGRMLGAFDPDDELDRPDLNKCPDCGCFFAQLNCPLCGKICPEEMRAGNRKSAKKHKAKHTHHSGRVTFVEWYHSWWFIILMLFVFPLAGIILFVTSPHKKSIKITFVIIGVIYLLISSIGLGTIIRKLSNLWDPVVDTSLSKTEYMEACRTVSAEELYRSADDYTDRFVSITLTVTAQISDIEASYANEDYTKYYLCTASDGSSMTLLIRDCQQENVQNFLPGDRITVYGEGAGIKTLYDADYNAYVGPCIHAAYIVLID